MTQAHAAVSRWLGQPGQCNSRIEALYQAVEDQDMTAIRAMMEAVWRAGRDAGGIPVHLGEDVGSLIGRLGE